MKTFSLCIVIAFLLICQIFASVFSPDIPGDGDVSCYPRSACLSSFPTLSTWAGTVTSPALVSGGNLAAGGSTIGLQIGSNPVTLTFSDPSPANPDPSFMVGPLGFNKLYNPVSSRDATVPISGQLLTINITNTGSVPLMEMDFYLQNMASVVPNGQTDGLTFGVYCTGTPDASPCSPTQKIQLLLTPNSSRGNLNPADLNPATATFGDLLRWTNINLPPGTTEGFAFYITDNNGTRKANTGGMAANATFTLQIVPIPVPTYTISGTVTFNGNPLSGVAVSQSGSASDLRSTDASGNYSFTGLFTGGYVLTPSKPGYNFTPATQTFNNLSANQTANFTASVATYTLSGKVTLNGNGQSGVTVALNGSASRSTLTDASGNYSFSGLLLGNYFLMPSKAGYSFTPPNATFNALSADQTANFTSTFGYNMSLSQTTLNFGINGLIATSPQTVALSFTTGANIGWTTSACPPNITLSPTTGSGNTKILVTASAGAGCTVTFTASGPGVNNSPIQLRINVNNFAIGQPFGFFDTPLDNTTGVSGAIGMGGWALDPVEVTDVSVWREPVGNEPAGKLIFIGTAVLVAAARPDVQAAYPNAPLNYRAGWGYALLTNFLPNSSGPGTGNGTYKIHVIVTGKSGATVDLGGHSITVDNAHATKPFGTIDTPTQGGTASGSAYVNFAWALTQQPYIIPINGSTLTVIIDGLPVGQPTYNQFRSDIASLFPGYMNSNGAVGYYYIDTTALANGVHTISWNVSDSAGHYEGIGSRYFTVSNPASGSAAPAEPPLELARPETMRVRRGFDLNRPAEPLLAGDNGMLTAEMQEMGRLEIELGAGEGYLLVNGERQPLPIGSSLKNGVFYWLAGPGFLGDYQLVFERPDSSSVLLKVAIRPRQFDR